MSITGNFDKIAVNSSSVLAYLFLINLFISLAFLIYLLSKKRSTFITDTIKHFWLLLSVTVTLGMGVFLQMLAIQKTIVPYVISIKRAGLIIGSILIGVIIFKEPNFRHKIVGGLVMTVGVLLILLFP